MVAGFQDGIGLWTQKSEKPKFLALSWDREKEGVGDTMGIVSPDA